VTSVLCFGLDRHCLVECLVLLCPGFEFISSLVQPCYVLCTDFLIVLAVSCSIVICVYLLRDCCIKCKYVNTGLFHVPSPPKYDRDRQH